VSQAIGAARARDAALQIKKGDIVLFHTGWQDMASKDAKAFMAGEPGLGKEGAEYLVSKEVVAIGADQWALEVIPFETGSASSKCIRFCCRGVGFTSWRT
jgi:kynurenine formamidase